jgi:ferric-chelate reductase
MTRSNTPFSQNTAEQGIIRAYRRPDLRDVFRGVIDKATNQVEFGVQGSGCGVFVGVCGPSGLRDGVKKAVRGVSWSDKRAVGGVKVHMESFGW